MLQLLAQRNLSSQCLVPSSPVAGGLAPCIGPPGGFGAAAPGDWMGSVGGLAPAAPVAAVPAVGVTAAAAGGEWMNFHSEYFCAPSKIASRTRKPATLSGATSEALATPCTPPSAPLMTTNGLPVIGSGKSLRKWRMVPGWRGSLSRSSICRGY